MTSPLESYKASAATLRGLIPGVDGLRSTALARLADQGLPTARQEAFRYTDVKPFKDSFTLARKPSVSIDLPPMLPGVAGRFVFVNGVYDEELSQTDGDIPTVSIRRLSNHLAANPDRCVDLVTGEDGLALINTALVNDGLVLQVASGVKQEESLEILHIMIGAEGSAAHPRTVIELGEGASLSLIERVIGDDGQYWFNPVTQARISERATLKHVRLVEAGASASVTSRVHVRAGAKATYRAVNGLFSGAMVRLETGVKVLGEGADLTVDGVSLAASGTRHDSLTHLDHQVPASDSDQIFRSVAAARGVSSFQGKVTVAVDAQHTEANQSFKALVLDRSGEANAKPELEILADDVQCAHGATIGELDAAALFYLVSRGIDPKTARGILIRSFLSDALVRFEGTAIAEIFDDRLDAWFDAQLGGEHA